ncbi:beta-lactamase/transpeptidase-like protein [Microthyrium microscopicum]|uniref:Beta-lactamase/transpeptidase-like protein n=1 Tax=Microthyrium microscopicum TaxID=703497 RepID=A0A6A6UGF8_9PEZI|nr:beta-lactamase/transpeptidase-like protein [Microthyrium microscopicum]
MATPQSATTIEEKVEGFTKQSIAEHNSAFHALVDEGKLANVVTLTARNGKVINCDAYGVHNVSATPSVPVKTDSIFRIASMAKPITAAAMMMLWEEGKWALEDPVCKFIPEFDGLKVRQDDGEPVSQESPMSMKQLMSHSAGFGSRRDYDDLRNGTLQDMIDTLASQPLFFQPGKAWRYGPCVDIQGYIIQKLTGKSVDEFLQERMFKPLGMEDSGWVLPESKLARLVSNHKYDKSLEKLVAVDLAGTYNNSTPNFVAAGGGLMLSTVQDYWRFSQMILNGGEYEGKRYLKAETVQMMHTNVLEPGVAVRIGPYDWKGLGFGLGFAIVQDPAASKTTSGFQSYFWGGAYGSWFWIDPIRNVVAVGFVNNLRGSTPAGMPVLRELQAKFIESALNDATE